jgi:hypothetical protein
VPPLPAFLLAELVRNLGDATSATGSTDREESLRASANHSGISASVN